MAPFDIPVHNEWMVSCETCRFARKVGKAPFNARQVARKHAHRYADHVINVVELVIRERWEGYTPQLTLTVADEPPF